jgi:hypothetical protein
MVNQGPQTIGYALADSPVAVAAYYYDKFAEWTDSGGEPEKVLSYDEMLDAISLYWLTNNTGPSSSRSYWEGAQAGGGPFDAFDIPSIPVAVFPAEICRAPRSWGERAFGNLIYWNEVDKGGPLRRLGAAAALFSEKSEPRSGHCPSAAVVRQATLHL